MPLRLFLDKSMKTMKMHRKKVEFRPHQQKEDLCLNFALKCLKNPKTNNMFCENVSKSHMKLRKHEKYKVQFANTERLKRSPLIYMQGLLNQNEFK